jgi:hypothetical protein
MIVKLVLTYSEDSQEEKRKAGLIYRFARGLFPAHRTRAFDQGRLCLDIWDDHDGGTERGHDRD